MISFDEIEVLPSKDIADFREIDAPIIDVRSPGEFKKGHIPDSINLPLFSDKERARVGTAYKRHGRDKAIELGLSFAEPKFDSLRDDARTIARGNSLRLYCARGGLRSRSVSWLLRNQTSLKPDILDGGFKSYRNWAIRTFQKEISLIVLGGLTGTGKTDVLHQLEKAGEQVLDLEGLANHRGSSFGRLGMPKQPTPQQFENLIAEKLSRFDRKRRVWVESESKSIGFCYIPHDLFVQMQEAPTVHIERSIEERVDYLTEIYGDAKLDDLLDAVERIKKRLGGLRAKEVKELLRVGNIEEATFVLLDYYDRGYRHFYEGKDIPTIDVSGEQANAIATRLLVIDKLSEVGACR